MIVEVVNLPFKKGLVISFREDMRMLRAPKLGGVWKETKNTSTHP